MFMVPEMLAKTGVFSHEEEGLLIGCQSLVVIKKAVSKYHCQSLVGHRSLIMLKVTAYRFALVKAEKNIEWR